MSQPQNLEIRGAREHNLGSIDVDIPLRKLVVITGVSGSGKSSLAFDTIYAEGQRRYVESLSAYARQFLNMMQKPEVDHISGLSPAISIEQKSTSRNPRSTVGTVTEIHDYLRVLFARAGTPYSPATGLPIAAQQVSDMVDRVMSLRPGMRGLVLAPTVRNRKGEYRKEFQELAKRGFQRVRVDGKIYDLDSPPELDKNFRHDIDVVVDRVVIRDGIEQRLADSFRTTLDLADGIAILETVPEETSAQPERIVFSEKFACPESGFTIPEIEPRLFSFNAPAGACPKCDGLGTESFFDEMLIVPDVSLSVLEGALAPVSRKNTGIFSGMIKTLAAELDIDITIPWRDLPEAHRNLFLYGSGERTFPFEFKHNGQLLRFDRRFEGIIPNLRRRYKETGSSHVRDDLERFRNTRRCQSCGGQRLRTEALAVRIGEHNLGQVAEMTIGQALEWAAGVPAHLSEQQREIATDVLKEIRERLGFLVNVGLDYLTLARAAGSLSGGESQRIRLASQIGSGLTGVLYVLDEPSIGLHQRDNNRLIDTLKGLRDQGNTVIVVEHDEEAICSADHVLDMGPGAGVHGGQVVAQGTPNDIARDPDSITGQYLCGVRRIDVRSHRRHGSSKAIRISGATGNNLKDIAVSFPLGTFICVTGVSGSGKSTLVVETLYRCASREIHRSRERPHNYASIEGLELIDKVIDINQQPIGRTPRSNPATYVGAFTPIRDWFSQLPESRARGYQPGRFSFNVKGGRCEACQGGGVKKIEMHFLADVYVTCESCKGLRYNRETLEIRFRDKTIADILDMTVEEGVEFFRAIPSIRNKLVALNEVGLGYIKIGQQATTLSGGEAQRVKLAKELGRQSTGKTLYILDEPTTGLHFEDIRRLLDVLHMLVDQGNTVIVIEHNLDVIKTADHIIDIGPEGGAGGGEVVATGTPELLLDQPNSHTGLYLKKALHPLHYAAA